MVVARRDKIRVSANLVLGIGGVSIGLGCYDYADLVIQGPGTST